MILFEITKCVRYNESHNIVLKNENQHYMLWLSWKMLNLKLTILMHFHTLLF